jgi:uncharacterized protein (DUF2336 family)
MSSQLAAADAATRMDIARKLGPCARTPIRLLRQFETMAPELSDFVLEHAVAYLDDELKEAIARGAREASAVAGRKALSPALANLLTFHDAADVLIALARNASTKLESSALVRLLRRARSLGEKGDLRLAEAMLERRPLPAECASLFLFALPDQRVEILLAAQRMQLGRPPQAHLPANSAALEELELAAVARHPDRFVVALTEALDCEPDLAQRIVDDASGEPLAVALTALGAANDVLVRVLTSNDLLTGESYQGVRALARLNNALDRSAAMMVVAAMLDRAAAPRRPRPVAEGRAPPEPSRATSARGASGRDDPPQRMWRGSRSRGEAG